MTNITVFGKPRAFESYDYVFGGESSLPAENVHREPKLKPKDKDDRVLHYFFKDNQAGLEFYSRVRGYESDREGIVFGVAIKSTTDFNIMETLSKVLMPYVAFFGEVCLDANTRKFKSSSIVEQLKGMTLTWTQEDLDNIQSISNGKPLKKTVEGKTLLLVADIKQLSAVEHLIKNYSDVYISASVDIFNESGNGIVLKEANKQIYVIENNSLKLITKADNPKGKPDDSTQGDTKGLGDWLTKWIFKSPVDSGGKGDEPKGPTGDGPEGSTGDGSGGKSFPRKKIAVAAILSIVIILVCLCHGSKSSENGTNLGQDTSGVSSGSAGVGQQPSEGNNEGEGHGNTDPVPVDATAVSMSPCKVVITTSWSLSPKIEPQNSCNVPSDITFEVSEPSLVSVDNTTYTLKVIKRPNVDTQVSVTAFIDGKELGYQTYTIAKIEQKPTPPSENTYRGRPVMDFLQDLKNDLKQKQYDWVITHAEAIIKGNYPKAAKDEANKLKVKAEKGKKGPATNHLGT